jgi:hypothetical protein
MAAKRELDFRFGANKLQQQASEVRNYMMQNAVYSQQLQTVKDIPQLLNTQIQELFVGIKILETVGGPEDYYRVRQSLC